MRIAIVGSRSFDYFDLSPYIPDGTSEIISGGAVGVDRIAKQYAEKNNIKYTEYLPDYKRYGRAAPLKRNIDIICNSDLVIVFWDGESRGSKFVIEKCRSMEVPLRVYMAK